MNRVFNLRFKVHFEIAFCFALLIPSFQTLSAQSINCTGFVIASSSMIDVSCNGGNNGSMSITVSGGAAPYQFSKDNGMTFTEATNPFTCENLTANTYAIVVKDANGCETAPTNIIIAEPPPLSISVISFTNPTDCATQDGVIEVSATGGTPSYQYRLDGGSLAATSLFNNLKTGTHLVEVVDNKGCKASVSQNLVLPNSPTFLLSNKTDILCYGEPTGSITITASGGTSPYQFSKDNGATFNAGTNPYIFENLVAGTYKIIVSESSGCVSTTLDITILEPPLISFTTAKTNDMCMKSIGTATISANGGTGVKTIICDICPTAAVLGVFSGLSPNTYTFTATDENNCTKSTSVTINSTDDIIKPEAHCKSATIQLNASGNATLTIPQIDDNSTDNCGITQSILSKTTFNCSNLGSNTVIFTATDASNNSATCSAIVTVEDKIPPSVICKSATIQLNASGNATLTIPQIDDNSTDNCGITQSILSKTTFNCSNLGSNTVIFTATDASNNSATCSATVTVEDKIHPSVICKSATIQLNASGNATLSVPQIDDNSTDNCGITQSGLSKTAFNCSNLGSNTVIFTATDASNNSATCSAAVTVEDKIPPSVICKSATIQLNASGNATLSMPQIDDNSTDNCGIIQSGLSKTTFNCSNLGSNTVIFTATDASNNSATCSATVTVEDKIPPIITCPANMVVQLGSGECSRVLTFSATTTDNCTSSPVITQLAGLKSGEVFGIGSFNTAFRAKDASGNTSECALNIIVKENIADGSMICLNQINVTIDSACSTKILSNWFLLGSHYGCFDNYSIQLMTQGGTIIPNGTVTAAQVGLTLKALVIGPNRSSCSVSTIKIMDFTPPTIQAPPPTAVTCDQVGSNGIPLSTVSGEPTILKECSSPTSFHFVDDVMNIACGVNLTAPPAGFPTNMYFDYSLAQNARRVLVRTFYVADRYGNTSSTQQVIYVQNQSISDVKIAPNLDLSCSNARTEPSDTIINGVIVHGTGFPTFPNNRAITESFCTVNASFRDVITQSSTTHSIRRTWTVINTCRNETKTLVQTITFHDLPPVMSLLQNALFQIPITHILTVKATDLISSLTDACTPNDKMVYGIRLLGTGAGFPTTSSLNFDCNQNGTFTVEIWVRDEGGNVLNQTTTFTVDNQAGKCPTVSGMILREDSMPVPATIMLYNAVNDSINSTVGTSYFFKDMLLNSRFRVMPLRPNTDWLNGVTMFDVALMSRHILGTEPLSTPYRLIAADINHSNDVDAVDMLLMQRAILHVIPAFTNNNSWRFVLKNYPFDDPTNPFASDFPESLLIPNFTNTIENGNFVAIKVGDVNLSAGSVVIRGDLKPFILSVDDKILEKNKTYQIPIKLSPFQKDYIGKNIAALQFALNIDKNKALIEDIETGDLPNFNENNIGIFKKEGNITTGWYRNPNQKFVENDSFTIFNLTIKPNENTRLSQLISLNPSFTEGVAFDELGNGAPVKLSFGSTYKSFEKPTLLPNRPNPFSDETTISFVMPEAGFAKLAVTDLMGRALMTTEKEFAKGLNEVVFSTNNTPSVSSGILIVRLQTVNALVEQKIVLSR